MANKLWQQVRSVFSAKRRSSRISRNARRRNNWYSTSLQLEALEDRLVPSNIWYVTSTADTSTAVVGTGSPSGETASNSGTLPWCVSKAANGDSIFFDTGTFAGGATITLTSTLSISKNVTIDGSNGGTFTPSAAIVIDGSSAPTSDSPLDISSAGSMTLEYLTMTGGVGTSGHGGGMIYFGSSTGTINIDNCIVTNCSSPQRGGFIDTHNVIVMNNDQLSNCSCTDTTTSTTTENGGGAVALVQSGGGTPSIQATDCTFTDCTAILGGGAIGTQTSANNSVTDCTFVGCVNDDTVGGVIPPSFSDGSTFSGTFTAGAINTCTVTALGSPAPTYAVTSGSLPANVTFSSSGALKSTSAIAVGGPYTFTITATNSQGSATQTFTLTVAGAPPSFSNGSTFSGTFYAGYSNTCTIAAKGSPTPTYALASGSTLPKNMSLSSSGSLTSTSAIAQGGPYTFTITATNSQGSTSQTITLTVSKKGGGGGGANLTDGTGNGSNGVTLTDGTGSNNQGGTSGPQGGGAIEVAGGTFVATGCVFGTAAGGGNSAIGSGNEGGGAVYVGGGDPTFTNCTFYLNTSSASGGAVNVAGSGTKPVFTNCQFTDNATSGTGTNLNGGAVDVASGQPTFTQCTFNGNATTGTGGAVEVDGGTLTITNCFFLSGNSSGSSGSAIYTNADTVVENTTITGNSASVSGAGIYATGNLTILNSYFTGNQAPIGAAVYVKTGAATILNTTFDGNTAGTSGGAIDSAGSNLNIVNDTITGNSASTGAGVEMDAASQVFLLNDMIAGNSGSNPDVDNSSAGSLTVSNSVIGDPSGNSIADGTNGNVVAPSSTGLTSLAQNGVAPYPLAQGSTIPDPVTGGDDQTYDQSIQLSPGTDGVGSGSNITNLTNAVTAGATTIVIDDPSNFAASNLPALPPLSGQTTDAPYFTLEFVSASGVASDPVEVESINGSTLTLVSGTLASHSAGDAIDLISDEVHELTDNPVYPNMGALEISNDPATSLVFTTEPQTNIDENVAFSVTLTAYNAAGVAAPTYGFPITLTLSSGGVTYGPVAANSGVVTFSSLTVTTHGTYTLTASGGGLTAVSTSFIVNPPIGAIHFTPSPAAEPPAATTAGATFSTTVEVVDYVGTSVGAGAVVTLNISSGTIYQGGSTATATTSTITGTTDSSGTVTFSGLDVQLTGKYTLSVSATDVSVEGADWTAAGTSNTFTISAGAVNVLSFVTEPPASTTAGSTITPVVVSAVDTFGNTVPGAAVTLSISSGALKGTPTATTNASGLATFSGLSDTTAGTCTLTAASGTATTLSSQFIITPAAAAKLTFTAEPPASIVANTFFSAAVQVTDAYGNSVPSFSVKLTPSASILSGSTSVASGATGTATFATLSMTKAGTYTLTASATGLTSIVSSSFIISPAAPSQLLFTTQPKSATAGTSVNVAVEALDAFGNTVPGVSISSLTLSPTVTLNNFATTATTTTGVAAFNGLSVNTMGAYTMTAGGAGLNVTSNSFAISPATVAAISFVNQPGTTDAGNIIGPMTALAVDAFGNPVPNAAISIALNGGSFSSGTTTIATSAAGQAVFSNLVTKTIGTYTLSLAVPGLAKVPSSTFKVISATPVLSFSIQPVNANAGTTMRTVTVRTTDRYGNVVAGVAINLTLSSGFLNGTTFGTTDSTGQVSFSGLYISPAGTGYTLTASSTGLPGVRSNTFNILPRAVASLAFTAEPANATAGTSLGTVSVQALDSSNNPVSGISVVLSSSSKGTLTGALSAVTDATGTAVFSNLAQDVVGTYTLTATCQGIKTTSSAYTVTAASAAKVTFVTQPTAPVAGSAINAVTVLAKDRFGNIAAGTTVNIGLLSGTLSGGTLTATTDATGRAMFGDLVEDTTGTYTLVVTAGSASAASRPFVVKAAAASEITFLTQPGNGAAGTALSPFTIEALDRFGNVATTSRTVIQISDGSLSKGPYVTGVLGQAVIANWTETVAGMHTVIASANGLSSIESNNFTIVHGAGVLSLVNQPSQTAAGSDIGPVTVRIADRFGNSVAGVAVAVGITGPGANTAGSLNTTATLTTDATGQAVFDPLTETRAGTYALVATASGIGSLKSRTFTVTAAAASTLTFVTQPQNVSAGGSLGAVTTQLLDPYGNVVTTAGTPVTMTISSGTLKGNTTAVTSSLGRATFNTLSATTVGTYTLIASGAGLNGTSRSFVVLAGAPSALTFLVRPAGATVGGNLGTVTVQVNDAFGNPIAGQIVTITVSKNVLTGTKTAATNSSGDAIFSSLSLSASGTFTLTALDGTKSATSSPFTITVS